MLKNIKIFVLSLVLINVVCRGNTFTNEKELIEGALGVVDSGYRSPQKLCELRKRLRNISYDELQELQRIYSLYKEAIYIADELYNDQKLKNLVYAMIDDVSKMQEQPKPQPGEGFIPNIDRYIQQVSRGYAFGVFPHYKRALEILDLTRTDVWPYIDRMRRRIGVRSYCGGIKAAGKYIESLKVNLTKIGELLKNSAEEWKVTYTECSESGLCRRDVSKKISAQQNAVYNELKAAVFEKMGKDFANDFNQKHPHATQASVKELAGHVDDAGWLKCLPSRIFVRIGAKEIIIAEQQGSEVFRDDIVSIIMSECPNVRGRPIAIKLT